MNRHRLRQLLLYGTFIIEFYDANELPDRFADILDDDLIYEDMSVEPISPEDHQFVTVRYTDLLKHLSDIDQLITERVTEWKITRIGKVELAAIRLAVYEMNFDPDVPKKVSINEAVLLAKEFGGGSSGSFVNGALSRIIK